MIAKKKNILTQLVSDFKNHKKIEKTYYAIVLWRLSRKEWTIKKPLKRIENAKWENKVQVANDWQTAITHFKLLKEHFLKTEKEEIILSEVEVKIETGRMHQIRVHMASIWNPIVWDKTYWDKQKNTFFEKNFWLKRQALHSWKIKFFHYWRNKKMELEAKRFKRFFEKNWRKEQLRTVLFFIWKINKTYYNLINNLKNKKWKPTTNFLIIMTKSLDE